MEPPKTNLEAGLSAVGLVGTAAAVGAIFGTLSGRNLSAPERASLSAGGATIGIAATGAVGLATSVFSPKWRRLGVWLAALGLGGLAASSLIGEAKAASAPALPPSNGVPSPGTQGIVAELQLAPGTQSVSAQTGQRVSLVAPTGGNIVSVTAPGLPAAAVNGPWVSLNVGSVPGSVTISWTDATGTAQTTTVNVTAS